MRLRLTVALFESNFINFMEEWKNWESRFAQHSDADITKSFKISVHWWNAWFRRFTEMDDENMKKLFSSCSKDLKPSFEKISSNFKAFQTEWMSFTEKYSDDPAFLNASKEHYELYKNATQVFHNLDAALKN